MEIISLVRWELRNILFDKKFMLSIIIGMFISLVTIPLLMQAVSYFKEGTLLSALPVSIKIIKIATVGEHPAINELEKDVMVDVVRTDEKNAFEMLGKKEVHGVFIVDSNSGKFYGRGVGLSNLAESSVRNAVDRILRKDVKPAFNLTPDLGLESLIKSLLAPFLLLTPLFLWSLPIIQSISYDRENKIIEILFATPASRKEILLAKVIANMLFAMLLGVVWINLVQLSGLNFSNPFGVYIIFLVIAFLIISMNALVSALSASVNEATLASSISSTIIVTLFFSVTTLKVFPATALLARLSPATYIAEQVGGGASSFPLNLILMLLIVIASALLLAISAFSTEAFAFAVKPGIKQLYEGMLELLKSKTKAAFAMGFVAFSITSPVQIIAIALIFLISRMNILLLLAVLVAIEEVFKALAITIIKPRKTNEGVLYGSLVGLAFGLSESILLAPIVDIFILIRIVPMVVHALSTGLFGIGYTNKNALASLLLAILLHLAYNLYLVGYL